MCKGRLAVSSRSKKGIWFAHAVGLLHEVGISNINIDLMYGLPHQSADDVDASAQLAALLSPQRIALFGYAHVPWLKANQKCIDEAVLPGVVVRLAQAQKAAETLAAFGYVAIGLDHFALPDDPLAVAAREGRLHRNFQGYTVDDAEALIGLGASAIGKLPQGFVQNAVDMAGYMRRIDGAQPSHDEGFCHLGRRRAPGNDHRAANVRSCGGPQRTRR